MKKTESFAGMTKAGKFAATSTEDARKAGAVAGEVIRKNLTSKRTMKMVFNSMQPPKQRRKVDLSCKEARQEAARCLKMRAVALWATGDNDEEVWPLLMGMKALESVQ